MMIPGIKERLRNHERLVGPIQGLAREGNFLDSQSFAVSGLGALPIGRAPADDRFAADERRTLRFSACFLDGGSDRFGVLAIYMGDHLPAVGLEALRGVIG